MEYNHLTITEFQLNYTMCVCDTKRNAVEWAFCGVSS